MVGPSGQLLLAAWELFADEIVSGIRRRGFPDFRLADTQVVRYLDPEGTRITALAERARMSKQAMSELVRRVERQGYVERRDDPEDGRAKRVHLTDTGRRGGHVQEPGGNTVTFAEFVEA